MHTQMLCSPQLHCTSCGFDSNNYDSFLDLSLEVGNGINT